MARKPSENKAAKPAANKKAAGKRVKIRVLPFRGIGGIGGPGTVAEVDAEQAREWVETGYAEYVKEEDK